MVKLTSYGKLSFKKKPAMSMKLAVNFSRSFFYESFGQKNDKAKIEEGKTVEYCI